MIHSKMLITCLLVTILSTTRNEFDKRMLGCFIAPAEPLETSTTYVCECMISYMQPCTNVHGHIRIWTDFIFDQKHHKYFFWKSMFLLLFRPSIICEKQSIFCKNHLWCFLPKIKGLNMDPPDRSLQYWGHSNHVWSYITKAGHIYDIHDQKRSYIWPEKVIYMTIKGHIMYGRCIIQQGRQAASSSTLKIIFHRKATLPLFTESQRRLTVQRGRPHIRLKMMKMVLTLNPRWKVLKVSTKCCLFFLTFCCQFSTIHKVCWVVAKVDSLVKRAR